MHTVVETPQYLIAAKAAGMSDIDREVAVSLIAANPEAGDIIAGSGGARKVRVPREDGGKRGGYRVITYFMDAATPVLLLWVISKGQSANLTEKQKAAVKESAKSAKSSRRAK